MSKKPTIHLVSDADKAPATGPQPLTTLGKAGRTLWDQVSSEFDISGVETRTLLSQVCESADRLARIRAAIDKTGEVIITRTGLPKANPAMQAEIAFRNFIVRTLARLGLQSPPGRGSGRPGGVNCGYTGDE